MKKPTIFFSHSGKDASALKKLKSKVLDITGNSVNIFLSSDGTSIPLGTNWISEVENALDETSLMFVFISPSSLSSKWLYFESGYSYSKKISVTPIGILGIDIGIIDPPLSLLQGFNVDNHKKLNNIISKINQKFGTKFKEEFEEDDYEKIFKPNIGDNSNSIIQYITDFELSFNLPDSREFDLKKYLKEKEIEYSDFKNYTYLHGVEISNNEPDGFTFLTNTKMKITPSKFLKLSDHLKEIISKHNKPNENIYIEANINENFSLKFSYKVISERLQEHVKLISDHFKFKSLIFEFSRGFGGIGSVLEMKCNSKDFDPNEVKQLIGLCLSANLIQPVEKKN